MKPINVKIQSTFYPQTPVKNDSLTQYNRLDVEQEKSLPGVIMALNYNGSNSSAFDLLHRLEDLDEPKIQLRVRNIMKLIPTDPKLLEAYDKITQRATNNNANIVTISETNSPVKKSISSSSINFAPLTLKKQESNSNFDSKLKRSNDLASFFQKDLPLNKILYNLEALCSRLAPLSSDAGTLQSSELFQQDFIKSGGMDVLINLLKLDSLPNYNNYEIKQNILILDLQILRLIIFGSIYPPINLLSTNGLQPSSQNKRPSNEPITGCAKKCLIQSPGGHTSGIGNDLNSSGLQNSFDNSQSPMQIDRAPTNILFRMTASQITEIVSQLLLLVWSSACGNINLTTSNGPSALNLSSLSSHSINSNKQNNSNSNVKLIQEDENLKPNKAVKFSLSDQRLSIGSNMSTSSQDSLNETNNSLHSGICMKNQSISIKDIKIASKAIEIISCFMQNRRDCIQNILSLSLFSECAIDVLTGSSSCEIRCFMEKFLLKLSTIETTTIKCKEFLLNIIIKARLPLWVNSTCVRESLQPLIAHSTQYFCLRGALLENLTNSEQQLFSINIQKMISDEINWLINFSPTKSLREIDSVLISGHLNLIKSLLTADGVNKIACGKQIIPYLMKVYLFPASFTIVHPNEDIHMEPMCSNESSTQAAFNLLTELSRNCELNFNLISTNLMQLHHNSNVSLSNEWNYIPLVTPRGECGYVGLKNGGATCYMNAVLQQLFMMPGFSEYILGIDDDTDKQKSLFSQLQNLFAYLKESKLEFYTPDGFWKAFRMIGQEVNIREQQDAFDFFMSLADQIDESLKKQKKIQIFKRYFEGTLANQFICKDCPHKYEREEVFFGLNLDVKSGDLQNSFAQFVKDELLDGDNSYNCEKCNEKRSAIKRTLLKKLPKYMCIQLKRFDYDWESNRSLKFDDYFEFPRHIDVQPYTTGEEVKQEDHLPLIDENKMDFETKKSEILYELVGIVVHSGQANAGHYYSFVKENNSEEKWLKFNDTSVEELNFTDSVLADECFGGRYYDSNGNKLLPEERVRYWNAYMLFYKIKNETLSQNSEKKSVRKSFNSKQSGSQTSGKYSHRDSLSELADLVSKGEEKGLFSTYLPFSIEQAVRAENLEFCRNREIYNFDYFNFIYNLCSSFKSNNLNDNTYVSECTTLMLEFLFKILFKTGKKYRFDLSKWSTLVGELLNTSKTACLTTLNYMLKNDINFLK